MVLLAWGYFLVQIVLVLKTFTPRIIAAIATPNLARSYGIPPGTADNYFRWLGPSLAWIYVPPAILFLANLALVWRARRREESAAAVG